MATEDLCYQTISELSKQIAAKKLSPGGTGRRHTWNVPESVNEKLKNR